ncbi:hypothetical protein DM01DRAFT_1335849 [Hesseltinella vesiculosa]|uniref:RhoGEF-domain-containing protein n=1 Tax=Hesseltinella vesiculosa TaxID=101127 RepID=A0A1X2GHI0_9FUNG|nr:hypothetical protein DM01DRAFT_1335849 [Hesseltinella vesiculosa]
MTSIEAPMASESITNKSISQQNSMYQTCQHVLQAITSIESLQPYLSSTEPLTPMNRLWQFCRQGAPLCILFNALHPAQPIPMDQQKPKAYVYYFIIACRDQLRFSESSLFTLKDVFQDDTNGFVRVVNVLKQIVTLMESHGLIQVAMTSKPTPSTMPKDNRDKLVMELLETERKYVHDLETLQGYMRQAHSQEVLPPDTLLQLFGNLDALVDCQRKFLVQLEAQADKAPQEQRFGLLFVQHEEAFAVYEPFCANFQMAQDLIVRENQALESLAHVLSPDFELPSMLIKPVQRICKYPLLMKKMVECTPTSWKFHVETEDGLEAIQRVAEKVNETRRLEENVAHVQDLKRRIDDWPADDIDNFGYLLLHDKFMIYRGDPGRELIVYLFEKCLFVCRGERDKEKDKKSHGKKSSKKSASASDDHSSANGSSVHAQAERLGVRGRILMSRVAQVNDTSRDGLWSLQVFWSEKYLQPGQHYRLDSFTMRCRNQEQLQQWESSLNRLIQQMKKQARETRLMQSSSATSLPSANTMLVTDSQPNDDVDCLDDEEEDDEENHVEEMEAGIVTDRPNHTPHQPPMLHPSISVGTVTLTSHLASHLTSALATMAFTSTHHASSTSSHHHHHHHHHHQQHHQHHQHLNPPGMTLPPLPRTSPMPASPTTKVASHPRFLAKMTDDHLHPYQQSPSATAQPHPYTHDSMPPTEYITQQMLNEPWDDVDEDYFTYASSSSSLATPKTPTPFLPHNDKPLPELLLSQHGHHPPVPPHHPLYPHGKVPSHTQHSNSISGASGPPPTSGHSCYNVSTRSRSQSSPNIHPSRSQPPCDLPSSAAAKAATKPRPSTTAATSSGHHYDKRKSNGDQELRRPSLYSTPIDTYPTASPDAIKIKVHHSSSIYALVVPSDVDYKDLRSRIQRKMKGDHATTSDLKYQDEDGDLITISSNDDLQMSFEQRSIHQAVNLFIS